MTKSATSPPVSDCPVPGAGRPEPTPHELQNHWQWLGRWTPQACEAVDWACRQFPPSIQRRGIARAYYDFIWTLDEILRVLPKGASGIRVLDVGCGAGVLALALTRLGARVTAVDHFVEYGDGYDNQMGSARDIMTRFRLNGIEVQNRDIVGEALLDDKAEYDLITCFAVIEHLPESPKTLLSAMRQALVPGGLVAITTPNHAWIRTRLRLLFGRSANHPLEDWWNTPFYGHVREYTLPELHAMLKWAGFDIRRATIGNWGHTSSRIRARESGQPDLWTTRFTLNSPERWMTAGSCLVTALIPSMRYSLLGIGRKPELPSALPPQR